MSAVAQLLPDLPVRRALAAMGGAHATWYRRQQPHKPRRERRCVPPLALSAPERETILETLNSARYADCTPYTAWARLLDEGVYLASIRTFYRVLAANGLVNERRAQLIHPAHAKPELMANAPLQLWSWDITKLKSTLKWQYFYLYVLIDIFSRYVVGWLLAGAENAGLARDLIEQTCAKHDIEPDSLTLHSDRGSPMRAKSTAELLVDLGVAASFSRPRVSNDNPFSEAQFKTLKYRPGFPERFDSLEHARGHLRPFFQWYNHEHRHSGIGLMTPAAVHFGTAAALQQQRAKVLTAAYHAHPERFKGKLPTPPELPTIVGINLPQSTPTDKEKISDTTKPTQQMLTNFSTQVSQSH